MPLCRELHELGGKGAKRCDFITRPMDIVPQRHKMLLTPKENLEKPSILQNQTYRVKFLFLLYFKGNLPVNFRGKYYTVCSQFASRYSSIEVPENVSLDNCNQKKVVLCSFLLSLYALSPLPWLMPNAKDLTEYLSVIDSYCL